MAAVHKSVLVGYSAEQMFALVERVEDYPQFLPWCGEVDVGRPDTENLTATLSIHYHGIHQKFTTRNKNVRPVSMQMVLVDGPFKHLEGSWVFRSLRADACKIEFDLQYEFSNKLLEQVIGPVFGMIANSFVDSFCKRADAVYG
jgi:ribosome-associated toxin RatA of RatAB toxin-antitoxin module